MSVAARLHRSLLDVLQGDQPVAGFDHDQALHQCVSHHPGIVGQVIDKIMGESEFSGTPSTLVWAGNGQAKP